MPAKRVQDTSHVPPAPTPFRRVAVLLALLIASQPSTFAADKREQKAKEAEAKRLVGLGRNAEKQGHLLEARQQYLPSEDVRFNTEAENGLERIAKAAAQQVKTLMTDAEKAYVVENFAKAAQILALRTDEAAAVRARQKSGDDFQSRQVRARS